MSMAIGHFAVGAGGTMVMFHMLPFRARLKMRFARVFIVIIGGLWAMLPDVVQYTNVLNYINRYWTKIELFKNTKFSDLTVLTDRLKAFHNSPWANINFFHHLMDVIDRNDSTIVSGFLIFVMLSVVTILALREFREQRSNRSEIKY